MRLAEAIKLIKQLWNEERVTFEGEYYQTRQATIYDRPDEQVPIYVAASGPLAAKLAGRAGDGFICTSGKPFELYEELLGKVREGAEGAGRDADAIDRMIEIKVSYDRDPERAEPDCHWWAALALTGEEKSGIEDPLEMERLADANLDRAHTRFIVYDDPEECVERISPVRRARLHAARVPRAGQRPAALPRAVLRGRPAAAARALRRRCRGDGIDDKTLLDASVDELCRLARERRAELSGTLVTYSPKVFIPLTKLCRDACGYCTFARPPRRGERAYMRLDEVLEIARAGAAAGCREALFTLGDKPELRYRVAREELAELGFATTLEYLREAARVVLEETGLLPHLNPGVMTRADLAALRPVVGLDGDHARDDRRAPVGTGRAAPGRARQGPGAAARDDPAGRRAERPVHERDPDRYRRDARGAPRRAARARRPGRTAMATSRR